VLHIILKCKNRPPFETYVPCCVLITFGLRGFCDIWQICDLDPSVKVKVKFRVFAKAVLT